DMFIVRGANIYPSAILSVVGEFLPRVTGRARVVRTGPETSIDPPVPVQLEVTERHNSDPELIQQLEGAIHSRLMFRSKVDLVLESDFGEAGYRTRLTVRKWAEIVPLPSGERARERGEQEANRPTLPSATAP